MSGKALSNPVTLGTNLVAIIGLLSGGAFLLDQAWIWWGKEAWAVCELLPPLHLAGHTVAVVLGTVGIASWALSAFRNNEALMLVAVAGLVGVMPGVTAHYLGASCAALEEVATAPPHIGPPEIPKPRSRPSQTTSE